MAIRPTFLGFNTMTTAITAAQKALDITGNNIANVDSVGYSRQRLDLVSIANVHGGLGYKTSVGLAGQGVNATGVTQIRDAFLDKRYRELNSDSAESVTELSVLTDIEDVLDLIDTDGFNQAYTNFKNALSSFSVDSPDNPSLANVALTAAQQAVQAIRSYNTKLTQITDQTKFELDAGVERVNQILQQISDLNVQISNEYLASGDVFIEGSNYKVNSVYGPNELKDSRNNLLDELSNYGNIEVTDNENGSINVRFAGVEAVRDEKHSTLVLDEKSTGALSLHFESSSGLQTPVSVGMGALDSGTLNGYLRRKDQGGMPSYSYLGSGALKGYLDLYNGAGVYANDIAIRQDGVKSVADDINDILTDISELTDAAARKTYEEALQEYDSTFAIDALTGEVTLNGALAVSAVGAATAVLNKIGVSINDTSSQISYTLGGTEITPAGTGRMKEMLDDTATSDFTGEKGIVYYRKVIDALANTFATAFNIANSDTTKVDTTTNEFYFRNMFDSSDGGVITAANIKVSDEWAADASLITKKIEWVDEADTSKGITSVTPQGEELWNGYISKLQSVITRDLKFTIDGNNVNDDDKIIDQNCTIDEYIKYWSNSLGQEIDYQNSVYAAADTMASNIADSRDAVMGVNIDEEGANMLTFQKWFNASSRMLTTLDEALDTIINSMGLVGR